MLDWLTTSAVSATRDVLRGALTAEQTVAASLKRIGEREAEIGAWQHLDEEHARTQARHCDAIPPGVGRPLHAIPIAIKDIFDTVDMPTTYGSAIYAGHRPSADAACVALARAAGAILLGKTVTTEFAGTAPGKTRNPHRLSHTPGGSSSGSAAAVAAGMVPLAIGSQTAGSTIRPAAFCGIVGFKPSSGLIDRTGAKPLAQSLDTVGVFARSVADAALFASVLSGRPELAAANSARAPRMGVYAGVQRSRLSPAALSALDRAARVAASGGAKVRELPVWERERPLLAAHETIMAWEVPQALAYERLFRREQLQRLTRDVLDRPSPGSDLLDAARKLAREAQERLDELFGDCDAVIAPAALGSAPEGLASTGDAAQNKVWTLLGAPAVCVPAYVDENGLPVGVQVIARPYDDAGALAVAAWLEQALRADGPKG